MSAAAVVVVVVFVVEMFEEVQFAAVAAVVAHWPPIERPEIRRRPGSFDYLHSADWAWAVKRHYRRLTERAWPVAAACCSYSDSYSGGC